MGEEAAPVRAKPIEGMPPLLGRIRQAVIALSGHPGLIAAAFMVLCAATVAALALVSRDLTFWHDDWDLIIGYRPWTLESLMGPQNEHWILTEALVWKVLLQTVGLHSYLPYLLVDWAAHLAVVGAVYWFVARTVGSIAAFAIAGCLLLLGSASQALFHATAFNLVVASAFGLWALVLLMTDGKRWQFVTAALLVLATASSGVGLVYVLTTALAALLTRWRLAWVALPSLVAYALWLVWIGRGPLSLTGADGAAGLDIGLLLEYVGRALSHAVAAATGLPDMVGLVLLISVAGGVVLALALRRRVPLPILIGLAGLLIDVGLIALARYRFGIGQAAESRYVYLAAPFLALIVTGLLTLTQSRGRWRRFALPAFVAVAVLSLIVNVPQFRTLRNFYLDRANESRAVLAVLLEFGGSAAVPDGLEHAVALPEWEWNIPGPARLREVLQTYGAPPASPLVKDVFHQMLLKITRPQVLIGPGEIPVDPAALELQSTDGLVVVAGGDGCYEVSGGDNGGRPVFSTMQGASFTVGSDVETDIRMDLAFRGPFIRQPGWAFTIGGTTPVTGITLPDLEVSEPWILRVQVPALSAIEVCGAETT